MIKVDVLDLLELALSNLAPDPVAQEVDKLLPTLQINERLGSIDFPDYFIVRYLMEVDRWVPAIDYSFFGIWEQVRSKDNNFVSVTERDDHCRVWELLLILVRSLVEGSDEGCKDAFSIDLCHTCAMILDTK